ncbi:MAG: AsmA family protein [Methylophilus sp.]
MAYLNSTNKKWGIITGIIAALIVAIALFEYAGWPFLAAPLEKQLSSLLNRQVSLVSDNLNNTSLINQQDNQMPTVKLFRVSFIGGLTLQSPELHIAAPAWSKTPHFIEAENVKLKLRYVDVWRAYNGQPVRVKSLQATKLDGYLERRSDGRASWQFSDKPTDPSHPLQLPLFDELLVANGLLHIDDVPLKAKIEAKVTLANNVNEALPNASISNELKSNTLTASAIGSYHDLPLKIQLLSTRVRSSNNSRSAKLPVAITFDATVGRANLTFKGTTADVMHMDNFAGSFSLKGPSLAAVGDLLGVTLPTTAVFNSNGVIEKQELIWRAKISSLAIGDSRLNGNFSYDRSLSVPLLKGQLGGKRLVITDLGPAFGATPDAKNSNKVLPSRPFDLASLRKMNADVMVNIQYLDLKSSFLEPLKPLKGHIQLKNGVLSLNDIKALTADGRLTGDMGLDGRGPNALWDAKLAWSGVRLERWVKQKRADGLPPYISGKLSGGALLQGQGKSTAEILASLNGSIRSELYQGKVSHLGIEVAGLDVAESLGLLFKGDDALPVQCAVVDLHATDGVFTPRAMVVDTTDSTVWVDGSLSLATETLNLRAMSLPKDFSPLTLRAPLNVTGQFSNPQVSLEKSRVGLKLAASVLLAIVNPLAAVIPLLDSGDTKEAKQRAAGCLVIMQKNTKAPVK